VFPSTSQCVCPMVVNAREVGRLTSLAAQVECDGVGALCVDWMGTPSCIDGLCDTVTAASDGGLVDAGVD
jgi:hypothetical protein